MIIDSHTHIGFEENTQKQNPEELMKWMDIAKVDKSVIFPLGPTEGKEQSYFKENENISKQLDNPRFIVFGRVNQLSQDSLQEVDHIKSLGLKGIKMHSEAAGFLGFDELFKKIEESGLPLIVHTGESEKSSASNLENIPFNGNLIIGHGGKGHFKEAIRLVNSRNNFFIETSLLSLRRTKIIIGEVIDKSKILFGSDAPFNPPEMEIRKLEYACKDKELLADILGNNILRIL